MRAARSTIRQVETFSFSESQVRSEQDRETNRVVPPSGTLFETVAEVMVALMSNGLPLARKESRSQIVAVSNCDRSMTEGGSAVENGFLGGEALSVRLKFSSEYCGE